MFTKLNCVVSVPLVFAKLKKITFLLILVLSSLAFTVQSVGALTSELDLTPISYITMSGSTGGQPVNAMTVKDQSGRNNNAKAYVLFTTPRVVYEGTQAFKFPSNIQRTALQTMLLKVNFMASARTSQKWSWFIYNWANQDWTLLGTSKNAIANTWTMLRYAVVNPDQFIGTSGEIIVKLRSSDAGGDAKVDYESIHLTYQSVDPAIATPTAILTSMPTTTQVISLTATPTSAPVVLPTMTTIPVSTSTSLPPTNTLLPTNVVTNTSTNIPNTATATVAKTSTPVVIPPSPTATAIVILPSSTATATAAKTATPVVIPLSPTATVTPVTILPSPTAINTNSLAFMIPAYFYPGSYWNQLITTGTARDIAIINPHNGPGSAIDTQYQSVVQQANTKNITIAGYVYTGYGTRDILTVKSDVDKYFNWYGITTIFFDEASNKVGDLPYYSSLYQYVKQRKGLVIINPGTITDEQYMSVADIVMIVETSYANYATETFPFWIAKYPANRFVHLIYDTPQAYMAQVLNLAKQRNAGYVYVTNDVEPNPWDTLPPYWNQEILP